MPIGTREIVTMANEYRKCRNPARRKEIIFRLHAEGGPPALEALARALGLKPTKIVVWAQEYYRQRNRWRRKRKPISLPPLPVPPGPERLTAKDARDIAVEAAERGRNEPLAVNRKDLELLAAGLIYSGEKLLIR